LKAFDPDPKLRWLIWLTHPDDEIFIAGWILRLVQAGAEVHLAWTHSTPERRRESLRACRFLGIAGENLTFLEGTDRHLPEEIAHLLPQVKAVVDSVAPDRVAVGAFEQGHLDHDATHLMVRRAFDGPMLEFPEYHPYTRLFPRLGRFGEGTAEGESITLTPAEFARKRQICEMYPSQRIALNLWAADLRARLSGDVPLGSREYLRGVEPDPDYRTPQHGPRMREEVEASEGWARWVRAVDALDN
jgi:hypothetical protein